MMSNALRKFTLIISTTFFAIVLSGCYTSGQQAKMPLAVNTPSPAVPQHSINCDALKRQLIYNQTNMNIETNDTTDTQRAALQQMITQYCH